MNVCILCSFIIQKVFFVTPEICLTASVIDSKLNLSTSRDQLCGDFRTCKTEHLTINFVCKLVF